MMGMVYPLKSLTKVKRPDNSSNNSFPSGHTAQAFLAAQFFKKEFGRRYPWVSVGMYTIASAIVPLGYQEFLITGIGHPMFLRERALGWHPWNCPTWQECIIIISIRLSNP
jgi:hypothetical protein